MVRRLAAASACVAACISACGEFGSGSTPAPIDGGIDTGVDVSAPAVDSGAPDAVDAGDAGDATAPCAMISWWTGDNELADQLGVNDLVPVDGGTSTYAPGKHDSAFLFDGTRAYEKAMPVGVDGLKQLTIEGWVKLATCGSNARRLIDHKTEFTNEGFYVDFIEDGGIMRARVGEVQALAGNFANDIFIHVAATYDGRALVLYANGVEVSSAVGVSAAEVPNTTVPLKIGSSANGSFRYCGLADEIALYGRALSSDEVLVIHANGPTARCKN